MRRTTGKMRRTTGDGCRQTTKNRYRTSSLEIGSEARPERCGKEEEDIGLVFCGRRYGSGVRERGVNRLRASCSDRKPGQAAAGLSDGARALVGYMPSSRQRPAKTVLAKVHWRAAATVLAWNGERVPVLIGLGRR